MATFFDSASLVMIPSGVKDDKLYSIKPTDGSGDFTFSRDGAGASPATRVNASGLIEKGRENLLLQSNSFDTTWTNVLSTETGGQSGYDGSNNAWLIQASSTGGYITQSTTNSGVQTLSVYAKGGNVSWIRMVGAIGGSSPSAYFNLSGAGAVGTTNLLIDSNIISVGSGWYRCSITFNQTLVDVRFVPASSDGVQGASGDNIYIQDAQLEQGLVATAPAIETTTAPVSAGLLGDMPRLDYSGGATCPSLLLEPSRVNQIENSEYYGGNGWTRTAMSINSNAGVSPDGTNNASYFVEDSSNGTHQMESNVVSGSEIVGSIFAKSGSRSELNIRLSGGVCSAYYDLDNGVVLSSTGGTASIEDYGNGWYRCILVDTSASFGTGRMQLRSSVSQSISYQGDGSNSLLIWGAQFEEASYPTSYIPTYGSASTRGNETAITSADTLGGLSIGTFFIEMTRQGIDTGVTGSAISLRDNAGAEELRLHFDAPASQVRWRDGNNGFAQIGGALAVTAGTTFKILIKSDGTTAKVFGNGAQVGSDYSIVSAFDLQRIYNYQLGYEIKQQLFFPTALTDAECIALTTI